MISFLKSGFCYISLFSIFLISCDSSRVFEENREIENYKWSADESVSFQVIIEEVDVPYNVYVNIRNAGHYRYSNFFLFINTHFPSGEIQRDTLECALATADGKWLGDGLGDIWDNRILFKSDVRFPVTGEYQFELIQAMRDDPVEGIMDAGIRIEKKSTD